jgi:hypothetical protein
LGFTTTGGGITAYFAFSIFISSFTLIAFLTSYLSPLSGGSCLARSSTSRLSSEGASSLPLLESPSPFSIKSLLSLNSYKIAFITVDGP